MMGIGLHRGEVMSLRVVLRVLDGGEEVAELVKQLGAVDDGDVDRSGGVRDRNLHRKERPHRMAVRVDASLQIVDRFSVAALQRCVDGGAVLEIVEEVVERSAVRSHQPVDGGPALGVEARLHPRLRFVSDGEEVALRHEPAPLQQRDVLADRRAGVNHASFDVDVAEVLSETFLQPQRRARFAAADQLVDELVIRRAVGVERRRIDQHRAARLLRDIDTRRGRVVGIEQKVEVRLALAAPREEENARADVRQPEPRLHFSERRRQRLEVPRHLLRPLLAGAADDVEVRRADANPLFRGVGERDRSARMTPDPLRLHAFQHGRDEARRPMGSVDLPEGEHQQKGEEHVGAKTDTDDGVIPKRVPGASCLVPVVCTRHEAPGTFPYSVNCPASMTALTLAMN